MVAEENRKGISLINERMDKLEECMHPCTSSCTPRMKPFEEYIDSYPTNTLEKYTTSFMPDILTTPVTHEQNTLTSTPTHPKKRKRN